jgi:hypothetical protein
LMLEITFTTCFDPYVGHHRAYINTWCQFLSCVISSV